MDAKLLPPAVAAKFPAILVLGQLDAVFSAACMLDALAVHRHPFAANQHQFAVLQLLFAARRQHRFAAILAVTLAASQLDVA